MGLLEFTCGGEGASLEDGRACMRSHTHTHTSIHTALSIIHSYIYLREVAGGRREMAIPKFVITILCDSLLVILALENYVTVTSSKVT